MLIDASVLLYAADSASPHHERVASWLEGVLNGPRRVGFAWPSITAFLRIVTHPRALDRPLTAEQAWIYVEEWLTCDNAWIPQPTASHAAVLGGLFCSLSRHRLPSPASARRRDQALGHVEQSRETCLNKARP